MSVGEFSLVLLKFPSPAAEAAASGGMGRTAAGRGTAATAGMTVGITFRNHDMGNGLIDQMIRIGRKAETAVCPIGF